MRFIFLFLLFLFFNFNVQAANIYLDDLNQIIISGIINKGDDLKLYKLISDELSSDIPTMVILDSSGGHVYEAINMSNYIRNLNTTTVVKSKAKCSSACSFLFVAGKNKVLIGDGKIGLHVPRISKINEEDEKYTPSWWNIYGTLISSLRNKKQADIWIDKMYKTASDEMFYITKSNFNQYDITYHKYDSVTYKEPQYIKYNKWILFIGKDNVIYTTSYNNLLVVMVNCNNDLFVTSLSSINDDNLVLSHSKRNINYYKITDVRSDPRTWKFFETVDIGGHTFNTTGFEKAYNKLSSLCKE